MTKLDIEALQLFLCDSGLHFGPVILGGGLTIGTWHNLTQRSMPKYALLSSCLFLFTISLVSGLSFIKIPLLNNGGSWLANISVSYLAKESTFIPLVLDTKLGATLVFSSQFCRAAAKQGFRPPIAGCVPMTPAQSARINLDIIADSSMFRVQCTDTESWVAVSHSTDSLKSVCCIAENSNADPLPSVSSISYWNTTAGSLGLAPAAASSHALSEFVNQYLLDIPILSLDLNVGSDSWISLGVAPAPSIIWSQYLAAPVYTAPHLQTAHEKFDPMQLAIFSLSICGAPLLDDSLGYMAATIDTGSSCLGLPPTLYSAFLSWTSFWTKRGGILYVRDDVQLLRLPTLSFSINTIDTSNSSQTFQIHLSSLVLSNRRLCVEELYAPTSIKWPPIVFGALVIANFHFSFDYQLRISGLTTKMTEQSPLNTYCAPAAVCWGQELLDESRNVCVSPYCSSRFFFRFDSTKRQCVMSTSLLSLVACLLGIIVASELLLDRWRARVCARM
jgi:hypothetical protein